MNDQEKRIIWVYADKVTQDSNNGSLAIYTADATLLVRMPDEGITKPDYEDED